MHYVTVFALVATLCLTVRARAVSEGGKGIQCEVSGVTNLFSQTAKAIYTAKDGLEIFAVLDDLKMPKSISIRVPKPAKGTFTLRDTPGLMISYSDNIYSSSSQSHCMANSEVPGSSFLLTIDKFGEIGSVTEGKFSGILRSEPNRVVHMTNGAFRLVRQSPEAAR